ncbi:hypothetical protein BDR03DRAFT_1090713 [Suillus americanus]|nr:hypothetical protein BDR03DRAFT_1090713 [Suillus americanus]
MSLPPPKRNLQMYGYYVSYRWLCDAALSPLVKIESDLPARQANGIAHISPLYSFIRHFGIASMGMGSAILPPEQTVPEGCMDNEFVTVLYIFSDQPDNYRQRPTQKQADELTKFVGRELQVGSMPGSFFD